jgi:O-antigen ligase
VFGFNWGDLVFVSRQEKFLYKEFFIRFAGQSSEPGYIVPLLSIPLMYGVFKSNFKLAGISIFYLLLTFSSFGYAVLIFSLIFFIKNVDNQKLKKKVEDFLIKSMALIPIIALIFFNKLQEVFLHNWIKLQTYFGLSNATEWSASQRTGHMELAISLFKESSWFSKIFGNGTGYYSKASKAFTKYYIDDGEEAHNLYVSTLTDRGILGLFLLLLMFYFISRIKISDKAPESVKCFFIAIKFGAYVRMFHWVFTGMLWQYYFWVEVALLFSLSVYYLRNSNEKL